MGGGGGGVGGGGGIVALQGTHTIDILFISPFCES